MEKLGLVKGIKSDVCVEKDYKGREMCQKYIAIYVELIKDTEIIILKQKLIDNEGKELENYNYQFTSVASAKSDKLIFSYKLPDENYHLKESSTFDFAYKLINTQKEITERFVLKNDVWEREI